MANKPFGRHWKGSKGYRAIEGLDKYNHHFGGQDRALPLCKLCGKHMHQIVSFDLHDDRLAELRTKELTVMPLFSCLNCSMVWDAQYFKLSDGGNSIQIISQENTDDWIQDEEDKLPVPLPRTNIKLIEMKDEDIPIDEEHYDSAFDLFGLEYLCRLLGAPLYDEVPKDLDCPICKEEMKYIATITQDLGEQELISVVDFQLGEINIYYYLCKDCSVLKTQTQGT